MCTVDELSRYRALQILDRLLKYLKERHHRCLIFSQFVIVLDIVQDFMDLRGRSGGQLKVIGLEVLDTLRL